MNRKSIILCLSVLAVMLVGLGVAVAFLYSESGSSGKSSGQVADEDCYLLLPAVPSDALAVFCHSDLRKSKLNLFASELLSEAGSSRGVVSVHHSGAGELAPLYIIDAGRATDEPSEKAQRLVQKAESEGLNVQWLNCSTFTGQPRSFTGRSVVVASRLENLVKSSVRHLQEGVSIMDASGFGDASKAVNSSDVLFIANDHARRIMSAVFAKPYLAYSSFVSRFADWTVFSVSGGKLEGTAVYENGVADFMSVMKAQRPATSSVASVLPSYTLFAATLPLENVETYLSTYESFVDSKQKLAEYKANQKMLAKEIKIQPMDFVTRSGVKEVAKAVFKVSGKPVAVNLMKVDRDAAQSFFDEDLSSKEDMKCAYPYRYTGFLSSLFGDFFSLNEETFYTYVDGWIVSGSRKAIEEYAGDAILDYTLDEQMTDSGKEGLFSKTPSAFQAYFSFSEDKDFLREVFTPKALELISGLISNHDYCPFVFRISPEKKRTVIAAELVGTKVKRTKAPAAERDTTVVVPSGPFQVKNSGTGKMNNFYQNSHNSLCLSEDGKDLWGIPFKEKICGYAQTIDYFANGKLQILFGAGSKLYLIDRLGRFVKGFPVDLGKEILLGPQPYDFNGINRYSAMVLHKDGTLELYNLKGVKPDTWKGIKTEETIKSLPEHITVGGKTFWVVRTSIQTLIFPFVGGEPLTSFDGDKKIRPDSPVTVLDLSSVEVECYDGRKRTVKLK